MRKLSWIIAGILCTTPLAIQAAELGAAKVQSQLTERLNVLIPLTGLNGSPVDEVKVRLAPESYYRQAGLSLDQLAGNITFQIKTEGAKSFIESVELMAPYWLWRAFGGSLMWLSHILFAYNFYVMVKKKEEIEIPSSPKDILNAKVAIDNQEVTN